MFRKATQIKLGGRMMKKVILGVLLVVMAPAQLTTAGGPDGRYHTVLFDSDHATEFTSGIGYIDFDGAGNYAGKITEVSQGQSDGNAFDVGDVNGTYFLSSNGSLTLGYYDSGYISADGSLIVWAPVPGDIPYEETGINVGIKQASGFGVESLNGTYNMVLFSGNHATEFSSGIGYLNFDGAGSFTFDINEVSHGQSTGEALGVETGSGTYSVNPDGEFILDAGGGDFTGYISSDSSLIVWATTPGSIPDEETGIGVGIKQGSGMGVESLKGTYNIVLFDSDHATEFTSGLGYVNFDGAGNYTGKISEVSQGQSPGSAFDTGPVSGTYSVDPNGKLTISNYSSGYVSADGSLIVWAPVPGDVTYEETGINIGIKKPSYPNLTGEYWFGSLSADANTWVPWGKRGTVLTDGNNWYQQWDANDGHHNLAETFTTSIQVDNSLNIDFSTNSYNVAWNGNLMIHADTSPDANNRLGIEIIARKATDIDVNDVIGQYACFMHWLGWNERFGGVKWGTTELFADGNMVFNGVNEHNEPQTITGTWELDDVNAVLLGTTTEGKEAEILLCADGVMLHFRPTPIPGSLEYDFAVKKSDEPITPTDIVGTYVVRFLETSVFGQPFTCGKGTAILRADGTFSVDAYYSDGEHDVFDANYTIGPGNKITVYTDHVSEGIISPDKSIIFLPQYQVSPEPEWWNWIGGIFLVRTTCNISDLNQDRRVNFEDYATFADQWLKAEPNLSANFNRDSQVDWLDLKTFVDNWLWNADWYTP